MHREKRSQSHVHDQRGGIIRRIIPVFFSPSFAATTTHAHICYHVFDAVWGWQQRVHEVSQLARLALCGACIRTNGFKRHPRVTLSSSSPCQSPPTPCLFPCRVLPFDCRSLSCRGNNATPSTTKARKLVTPPYCILHSCGWETSSILYDTTSLPTDAPRYL